MGPFAFRSWVEISLKQIADNFNAVRAVVGPKVEVMPVVKADAYRHGAVEVSRALMNAGARWLAVSNVEEGAILRDRGINARILVMADFLPAERAGLFDYNLTPVIHSLDDVTEWDRLCAARGVNAAYHLKIDSGMGRLGTLASAAEILETVASARNAQLEGLMTHLALVRQLRRLANRRTTRGLQSNLFKRMRFKSGCPEKTIPNMSKTSRSCQFAAGQTLTTLGTSSASAA